VFLRLDPGYEVAFRGASELQSHPLTFDRDVLTWPLPTRANSHFGPPPVTLKRLELRLGNDLVKLKVGEARPTPSYLSNKSTICDVDGEWFKQLASQHNVKLDLKLLDTHPHFDLQILDDQLRITAKGLKCLQAQFRADAASSVNRAINTLKDEQPPLVPKERDFIAADYFVEPQRHALCDWLKLVNDRTQWLNSQLSELAKKNKSQKAPDAGAKEEADLRARLTSLSEAQTELESWLSEAEACDRVEKALKTISLHSLQIDAEFYRNGPSVRDKSVPVTILELTTEVSTPKS
jgi:hypothetical protein